ncbi:diacylglycerol/lipid kinase family protein [Taibaiella koreensis]|uniref:diacylglycerol/lipid kinase family protein n=1 Tax=Taibaiella koreensis TaxID=1268548 RepID=UPI000E599D1B|nr:diacylglycerol kinase family protein [Taibaiella koreensis]
MKSVKLYYNPTAGEGAHSKAGLIQHIRDAGYTFINTPAKKAGVGTVEKKVDILAVAGGDGTVRKACLDLLHLPLMYNRPIGLLALGTANNIALTLKIVESVPEVIRSWDRHKLKRFDVGRLDGLSSSAFFVEAFGFGIFPRLMLQMNHLPDGMSQGADEELQQAFELLVPLAQSYEAVPCSLDLDGKAYAGKYILAEVMNIRSLGPRLVLAPGADPGDGRFDVLLIPEKQRPRLVAYIEKISRGIKARFPFRPIKARHISIRWEGKDMHVDDKVIHRYKPAMLQVKLLDGMLDFLTGR